MQAIVLAAGFGTRLRPYTLIRPKPLFPVLNRPLLSVLLDRLGDLDCRRIVVNCHHLAEQIQQALSCYPEVICQFEPEILGTGGSLRRALANLIDEPLLVMNGDIFHNVDLAALYQHHRRSGNKVTLAVHDYPRFNTVTVADERVLSFKPVQPDRVGGPLKNMKSPIPAGATVRPSGISGKVTTGPDLVAFTGIHVVEPEVLAQIPRDRFYHIIDLYQELAGHGQVGIKRVDGAFWQDIGTPEDYLQLHRQLLAGITKMDFIGEGKRQGNWLVAEDVRLAAGVELRDWGCLGRGVRVGRGTILSRCVVWDGADIGLDHSIADAVVS